MKIIQNQIKMYVFTCAKNYQTEVFQVTIWMEKDVHRPSNHQLDKPLPQLILKKSELAKNNSDYVRTR